MSPRAGARVSPTVPGNLRRPHPGRNAWSCWNVALWNVALVERLRVRLRVLPLVERDLGDREAVLHLGEHADGAVAAVRRDRPGDRVVHRSLRLAHRRALRRRRREIVAGGDRPRLDDGPPGGVEEDLEELATLLDVDGELQFALLQLELSGDRPALL